MELIQLHWSVLGIWQPLAAKWDSNQYAGKQDYELELEVEDADKGKADFDRFLAQNHIHFKYAKSKVARFSATLK